MDIGNNYTEEHNEPLIEKRLLMIKKKQFIPEDIYYHCEIASCIPSSDVIKAQPSRFGKIPLTKSIAEFSIA